MVAYLSPAVPTGWQIEGGLCPQKKQGRDHGPEERLSRSSVQNGAQDIVSGQGSDQLRQDKVVDEVRHVGLKGSEPLGVDTATGQRHSNSERAEPVKKRLQG